MFDGSNKTDTTDIFVVDLISGAVKGPLRAPWVYSAHHVNAYQSGENEIILDLNPTPFDNMRDYLTLDNMMNPPAKAFIEPNL